MDDPQICHDNVNCEPSYEESKSGDMDPVTHGAASGQCVVSISNYQVEDREIRFGG